MPKTGNIYLWTGEGAGKTTSALGVALRAVGQGKKVVIIQFMKGRKNIGEYKVRKKLGHLYEIHQFGRKGWVNIKNPSEKDKELAKKGLEFAKKAVRIKPFLLILDELNLAVYAKLLKLNEVLDFLDKIPGSVTVYLTGRKAPKKLVDRADFATRIETIKMPRKMTARKGIEY